MFVVIVVVVFISGVLLGPFHDLVGLIQHSRASFLTCYTIAFSTEPIHFNFLKPCGKQNIFQMNKRLFAGDVYTDVCEFARVGPNGQKLMGSFKPSIMKGKGGGDYRIHTKLLLSLTTAVRSQL